MRHTTVLSAILGTSLLAVASMGQAAEKKSLVFCSEGSPAGFDTAQYTTATDNDAAEPIYNRLVEFEKGETGILGPVHRLSAAHHCKEPSVGDSPSAVCLAATAGSKQ